MNNRILVFSVVIVALLLIGLNFESLYNYVTWHIPLSKINQSEIIFVQKEEGNYDRIYSPTMKDINYINDDSVEITFAKTQFIDYVPNSFEFTKIIHKGNTFITLCREDSTSVPYAIILRLARVNSTFVSFHSYEVDLPKEIQCKYPEIIQHSFDIKWNNTLSSKADFTHL